MNDLFGNFSYEILRDTIVNYYKEKGLRVLCDKIEILKENLIKTGTTLNYFKVTNGKETSIMNISNEMIRMFISGIVSNMGLVFKDVEFKDKIEVKYSRFKNIYNDTSRKETFFESKDSSLTPSGM